MINRSAYSIYSFWSMCLSRNTTETLPLHALRGQADHSFAAWVKEVQAGELTCFDAFIQLLEDNKRGILV